MGAGARFRLLCNIGEDLTLCSRNTSGKGTVSEPDLSKVEGIEHPKVVVLHANKGWAPGCHLINVAVAAVSTGYPGAWTAYMSVSAKFGKYL